MAQAGSGNAGEAMVLAALVRRGFHVLIPFGEGQPYDLVIDLEPAFMRVQCKTGWPVGGCELVEAKQPQEESLASVA